MTFCLFLNIFLKTYDKGTVEWQGKPKAYATEKRNRYKYIQTIMKDHTKIM